MKLFKFIFLGFVVLILFFIVVKDSVDNNSVNNIVGLFFWPSLSCLYKLYQDMFDVLDWQKSQRMLIRGKFITNNTVVRISFSYLYRIKVGDKYLLIKNDRGTDKYQPIGGVYKFEEGEKLILKNKFQIIDDSKIPIDESSYNDYRLRLKNKYLRKFIQHFDVDAKREKINNLSREFREEVIESSALDWNEISYRFCGRHMTKLNYSDHFQIYELLLADIVEVLLNKDQEKELNELVNSLPDKYRLATEEEILSLGVNTNSMQLRENISNHSTKILQIKEDELQKITGVGKVYSVRLK